MKDTQYYLTLCCIHPTMVLNPPIQCLEWLGYCTVHLCFFLFFFVFRKIFMYNHNRYLLLIFVSSYSCSIYINIYILFDMFLFFCFLTPEGSHFFFTMCEYCIVAAIKKKIINLNIKDIRSGEYETLWNTLWLDGATKKIISFFIQSCVEPKVLFFFWQREKVFFFFLSSVVILHYKQCAVFYYFLLFFFWFCSLLGTYDNFCKTFHNCVFCIRSNSNNKIILGKNIIFVLNNQESKNLSCI